MLIVLALIVLVPVTFNFGQDKIQKPLTQPYSSPSQHPPVSPKSFPEILKDVKPSRPSTLSPTTTPYSLNIDSFNASAYVVNYGEEITVKWTIKGNNLSGLKLEIMPDIGTIPLTRTDYRNETLKIEGSKTIQPLQSGKYILSVSVLAPYKLDVGRTGDVHQSRVFASKDSHHCKKASDREFKAHC